MFFNTWNIGAILLGVGILYTGTFLAYIASGGRSLIHNPQGRDSAEGDSPWIKQWNDNCEATLAAWIKESPSDFVDKILLAFVPVSSQTFENFMKLLSQGTRVSKNEYIKVEKEISCSSDYATDGYLAKLLLAQIIYFHVVIFMNDRTALLNRNNLTLDSFFKQFHKPMPVSRMTMKKYERTLKNNPFSGHRENEEFYIRFLNFLEMKPTEELLVLVDLAFRETFNSNIEFIVKELENNLEDLGERRKI